MSEFFVVLSHITAFVLGALTTWGFLHVRRIRQAITHEEEEPMKDPQPVRVVTRRGPTPGALILVILLAAAMLIGFGIQQSFYQAEADKRDACYEQWGKDVISSLESRTVATKRYERVTTRKENALDTIILVVIGIRKVPPEATERDFAEALTRFANLKTRQEAAKANLNKTRAENPYPTINCD